MKKLAALLKYFAQPRRHGHVSPVWLRRTMTRMDRVFAETFHPEWKETPEGHTTMLAGLRFLWPKGSGTKNADRLLSEVLMPEHPHQYDWGATRIGKGDAVLDIGACEGFFGAIHASRGAVVHSVEPSPSMAAIIRQNYARNGLEARIIPALAGTRSESVRFFENRDCPGSSRIDPAGNCDVRMAPLDDLCAEHGVARVDFIKIDCEGADFDVLQSAEKVIARDRPAIAVTTYHCDDHFDLIREWLTARGYQCEGKGLLFTGSHFRVLMLHAFHPGKEGGSRK